MPPRKKNPSKPSEKGFLGKLRRFAEALGDRYQRVLHVIDEALASDNLKDKIWAVDLILKRTPPAELSSAEAKPAADTPPAPEDLDTLDDAELLSRIRAWQPGPEERN